MLVYLGGPIKGKSWLEAIEWRQQVENKLNMKGIYVLDPMRHKSFLNDIKVLGDADESNPLTSQKGIVARDRMDVMRCDVVLFNLLNATEVSKGTCVEYGWADAFRKTIVTVMTEDDAVHNHSFIRELTHFMVRDTDAAVQIILSL